MPSIQDALTALKQHFGFDAFRTGQREVIESILAGHDTVVVMPTGGGKSLCYQLPALLLEGAMIVVSPLIALMKDQVDSLQARDLPATLINSSLSFQEQKDRIAGIRNQKFKLVYVAPERFRSANFVDALASAKIALFAVDEAHCVSHWGHDFRPDYLRLKESVQAIGRPQMVALTATATPHVRSDLSEQLGLKSPHAFVSGFDRPNLRINVINTDNEVDKIRHIKALAGSTDSGIIYTSTRKTVDQVAAKLRSSGLGVVAYHAGVSEQDRIRAQDSFMTGKSRIIVATNAFGMGIDKSDIRFVVHFHMPGSIEAYYQEIGRAGRDGQPSTCSLLFNYADKRTQDYFIEGSFPTPDIIAGVYRTLVATGQKRIELSAAEIAARSGIRNEMSINSALTTLEKAGHIERPPASESRCLLRLNIPPAAARQAVGDRDATARQVLFALMNGFELNNRSDVDVDLPTLVSSLALDMGATRKALSYLASTSILSFQAARRGRGIVMLDDAPVAQLRVKQAELARRAALEQRKLREMISYCYTDTCYRAFILDYFGDKHHDKRCGACGNCLASYSESRSKTKRTPSSTSRSELDDFLVSNRPTGMVLEDELAESSRRKRENNESLARPSHKSLSHSGHVPRPLSAEETVIVRKILACAARMEGRFGKNMLAATLKGSTAKNVIQFHLDKLSTYGLLSSMAKDEILSYIEALLMAGALCMSTGSYPRVSATPLGLEVMREKTGIELSLGSKQSGSADPIRQSPSDRPQARRTLAHGVTIDETYKLYQQALSIEEIAALRSLSPTTIETHLASCIEAGRDISIDKHVPAADQRLIEAAIVEHGADRLRPLREALPDHISYRMIRFVVAHGRRNR